MSKEFEYLFVYGKLRKGFWSQLLLRNAPYVGKARTVDPFALYVTWVPYVTTRESISTIVGDVYQVDSTILADTDRFKGHPDWYTRQKAKVELENGAVLEALLYVHPPVGGRLIRSGDYDDASAKALSL
jgi:gamma-glutamylaminecyclotransferase